MTTLRVKDLSIRRGAIALTKLSLELHAGEALALIGPNGGGKTTLLACLSNLLSHSGSVKWAGMELTGLKRRDLARVVGYLPQRISGLPGYRVEEFLHLNRFAHRRWGIPRERRDYQAVQRAMEMARVAEFRNERIDSLSGGELQRALLAGVLAQETPVVLLDEPTTSLDPLQEAHFFAILRQLLSSEDKCVVLASHKVSRCMEACGKILGLRAGQVIYYGPTAGALAGTVVNDIYGCDDSSGDLRLGIQLLSTVGDES